jgi:hypothetical protein
MFSMDGVEKIYQTAYAPAGFGVFAGSPPAFLGAEALDLPRLAFSRVLGAPFFGLASFFEVTFTGATVAPCSLTAADVSVVSAFWVVIFV